MYKDSRLFGLVELGNKQFKTIYCKRYLIKGMGEPEVLLSSVVKTWRTLGKPAYHSTMVRVRSKWIR